MSGIILQICVLLLVTPAILGRPQQEFFTFKDGKVGVNYGGYHASAGLGGLLTGNAAHGGLSAAAGTPYGQHAGAGLGGSVDGKSTGGAYAAASAGGDIGASAGIGGNAGAHDGSTGVAFAEAHSMGKQKSVVKVAQASVPQVVAVEAPVVQPELSITKTIVANGGVENIPPPQASVSYENTLVADAGADNIPQTDTVVYQKVKTKKKLHTRPVVVQPVVQQTIPTVHEQSPYPQAPVAGGAFDFRKFLDFGLYANAGFGGVTQTQPQVVVQNHHRRLKPHHKRIQYVVQQPVHQSPPVVAVQPPPVVAVQQPPVVAIHKSVYVPPPPTVQIHKTIHAAPAVVKHPVVIARPQSSEESSESLSSDSFESHEYGTKTKVVSYTSGVHGQHGGGTFFDGVFGIPIATLGAVNQFLNGRVAGGGGVGFQKSITVTKG